MGRSASEVRLCPLEQQCNSAQVACVALNSLCNDLFLRFRVGCVRAFVCAAADVVEKSFVSKRLRSCRISWPAFLNSTDVRLRGGVFLGVERFRQKWSRCALENRFRADAGAAVLALRATKRAKFPALCVGKSEPLGQDGLDEDNGYVYLLAMIDGLRNLTWIEPTDACTA